MTRSSPGTITLRHQIEETIRRHVAVREGQGQIVGIGHAAIEIEAALRAAQPATPTGGEEVETGPVTVNEWEDTSPSPMALEIKRDWCLVAAEREGDSEVGAGLLNARSSAGIEDDDIAKRYTNACFDCSSDGASWSAVHQNMFSLIRHLRAAAQPATGGDAVAGEAKTRSKLLSRLANSLSEWQERPQYDIDTAAEIILGDLERAGFRSSDAAACDAKAREIVTEWLGMFDPPPQIDFQQSESLQGAIAHALSCTRDVAQPASMPYAEWRESIGVVLYNCEKFRAVHAGEVLSAAAGKQITGADMEPWEECSETFLSDADAVIDFLRASQMPSTDGAAQPSQDEMENYRLALAWIKEQSADPQAKEIAATALDSFTHTSPQEPGK